MIRPDTCDRAGTPATRPRYGAALLVAVAALSSPQARGQVPAPQSAREVEKIERQRELEILRSDLDRRKASESKLKAEIDAIKNDRKKFSQAILDAAARIKAIEGRLSAAERRLTPLDARETEIRRSLESRQSVLAELLAAAARLSRQPAPAVMLRPEDALTSVRSAMLLSAVVPELRAEAEVLAADLAELAVVRKELVTERDMLADNRADLERERMRLSSLVEERQKRQTESEKALDAERARSVALAKQVETVTELVARMEKEIEAAARAAEAASRQTTVSAFNDPGRIAPAIAFAAAKGRLPLPATGTRLRDFGSPDGAGGTTKGIQIATRSEASITAPCDGWIVYAGPFRSYGRLLIINAGGGYHVLLAGMEKITVELGQFVLAGEPVAVMGSGSRTASTTVVTASQPVLYIEFRKDGNSINPDPWWADTDSEKARG